MQRRPLFYIRFILNIDYSFSLVSVDSKMFKSMLYVNKYRINIY